MGQTGVDVTKTLLVWMMRIGDGSGVGSLMAHHQRQWGLRQGVSTFPTRNVGTIILEYIFNHLCTGCDLHFGSGARSGERCAFICDHNLSAAVGLNPGAHMGPGLGRDLKPDLC